MRSPALDIRAGLVNHAAFLYRDGLKSVVGVDDGGPMDAMGLGWVIMAVLLCRLYLPSRR